MDFVDGNTVDGEDQIEGQGQSYENDVIGRGGWKCLKCNNINYADRDHCNMRKCREPRPPSAGDGDEKNTESNTSTSKFQEGQETDSKGKEQNMREGDWICKKCSNINFATRVRCNMRKCQAPREEWVCPACKNINYKFRTVCNMRKCQMPRPPETYPDFPNTRGYGFNAPYGMFPMSEDFGFQPEPSSLGHNQNYPQLGALVGSTLPSVMMHPGPPRGYEYRRGDMSGRDIHMNPREMPMRDREMHDDIMSNRRAGGGNGGGGGGGVQQSHHQREGDWECLECGNINFANRQRCNMRKCRAEKP